MNILLVAHKLSNKAKYALINDFKCSEESLGFIDIDAAIKSLTPTKAQQLYWGNREIDTCPCPICTQDLPLLKALKERANEHPAYRPHTD